ncbi:MAG: EamA/RhaT family transporter, partial [Chloroflexi bacterium]
AFFLFGETLALLQFGGIVLLLSGIAIASIAEQRAPSSTTQQPAGT